jgi:hypothetical protein
VLKGWGFRGSSEGLEEVSEVLLLPVSSSGGKTHVDNDGGSCTLAPFRMRGFAMSPGQAARGLARFRGSKGGPAGVGGPSASLECWSLATAFALELVARGRVVPRWRPVGAAAVEAIWTVAAGSEGDRVRFEALAAALPPAARATHVGGTRVPENAARTPVSDTFRPWPAGALLRRFIDDVADALVRAAAADLDSAALSRPITPGVDWVWTWLGALLRDRETALFQPGEGESDLLMALERWIAPAIREEGDGARGCIALATSEGGSSQSGWSLELALQAEDDPAFVVPPERVAAAGAGALGERGRIFRDARARLERAALGAAALHPLLKALAVQPARRVPLDDDGVAEFLTRAAPLLRSAGFGVIVPIGLTRVVAPQARLCLDLDEANAHPSSPHAAAGRTGTWLDGVLRFRWEVALGEEVLSVEEFQRLVDGGRRLVRRREGWIVLRDEDVVEVRRRIADPPGAGISGAAKLLGVLAGGLEVGRKKVPVLAGPALDRLLTDLRTVSKGTPEPGAPAGFVGDLRPYQTRGVQWLAALNRYGLGGILADEMGLGKTIQLIGHVLEQEGRAARADGDTFELDRAYAGAGPWLVVCPASVLGNWQHELARFAPALPVLRHHGSGRSRSSEALEQAARRGVVLTTYGTLRRDADMIAAIVWRVVALDEAQNIKNADSSQARAARRLRAGQKVALTGTPIENRLDDLWSISEFANPGLLGSRRAFRERFALPIEREGHTGAADLLRNITAPFVLRRLKSQVAPELPDRIEMSVFCTLTSEQAALYQAVVDESLEWAAAASGMERRGRILALLTRLKQVVNHPAQYLGESHPLSGRSGKLSRLGEMLQEVVDDGERALVFTQYREMGELLTPHLGSLFGRDIPFLHGGVPAAERDRQVREFQTSDGAAPVFVLSLRAGGTGLNLTRANHVFHYDRWWNPAVEDQATDRAHRIGQRNPVFVHKFVTLGTLEDRIAALLERKRALADSVIATGDAWLTELPDEELRALVALDPDAVLDEDGPGEEPEA